MMEPLHSYGDPVECRECGEMVNAVFAPTSQDGREGRGLCMRCAVAPPKKKRTRKEPLQVGDEVELMAGTLTAATFDVEPVLESDAVEEEEQEDE